MIYGDETWKANLVLMNAANAIVRQSRRTDPAEGGNIRVGTEETDFVTWFDKTWDAVRNEICRTRPIMDEDMWNKALLLGKGVGTVSGKRERIKVDDGHTTVAANDLIGMLQFGDVVDEETGIVVNERLKKLLDKKPGDNPYNIYNRVALDGPEGNSFPVGDPRRTATINKVLFD